MLFRPEEELDIDFEFVPAALLFVSALRDSKGNTVAPVKT